ncbi:MAG: TonB-dependent receptor [Planctomycetota bacterium]
MRPACIILSVTALLIWAGPASAQSAALLQEIEGYLAATDGDPTELEPVVVAATRYPTTALESPATVATVREKEIEQRAYRTTPQALRNVPGVMVQETAAGQGSPFIRGFTGYRNLLLIDGIRLNNSVFRSGPNQYWNTVDPYSIESYELVKGPSSVLWGSDAIGGTVLARTRTPYTYEGELDHGGRLFYRGATAENSHTVRGELSLGFGERAGLLVGVNYKEYGDLIAGGNVGRQTNVGYDEWDGDFKLERFLDPDTRLVIAYQHVRQNAVPRTHKTIHSVSFEGTTVGSELQRDLDQERQLVYAQFHKENLEGFAQTMRASLSYQLQQEDRDRIRPPRDPGDPVRADQQGFDAGTIGAWTQFDSDTAIGKLSYGLDYYHDNVNSYSTGNPVQGPVADDATYDLLGLFVQDLLDVSERFALTLGARFNWAAVDAKRVFDPVTQRPIRIEDDWGALVGSVRGLYRLEAERWHLHGGISQGFRAPNLSDLTRLDSARTDEFEVPSPGLDPEYYTSFELGIKGNDPRFSVDLAAFYTDIRDQITRVPTGDTTPDGDTVVVKDNVGNGYVWGIEFGGAYRFSTPWTLFGNLTYLEGKVDTYPTSLPIVAREWMSRLMPLTAQIGVHWEQPEKRFWGEAQLVVAAKADRLSTRDEADTDRIPPGGTPGYWVFNLRGGWNIKPNARVTLAVENLFDETYRIHGSGITMPGTNLVLSATFDF